MTAVPNILVLAGDDQVGRWLQHRIETLEPVPRFELDDTRAFERRLATTGAAGFDLVLAALDFAPEAGAFDWIDQALDIPDMPPLVVVAEHGDELAATGCIRRGVVDYLPRAQLTAGLLSQAIDSARKAGSPRRAADAVAPMPAHPTLTAPRGLIPRYTLLDMIGESARATVYLAYSSALGRNVALKVSRASGEEESQFAREFAAVGSLRNASVVNIHDYGMHDGREFIAMEYFPCGDLKSRLQNPLTEHECLAYLRRVARALSAVHSHGIVHRDLKPPNIMLRDNGQVVLIDFGIARAVGESSHSTRAGVLRGSPYYMSPEQAQGHDIDARSDLYSLGVIFYEMLTGAKPYLGNSAIEVLQQHVTGDIPLLPRELAHYQPLLEGMLAKDPADRFDSADALLSDLAQEFTATRTTPQDDEPSADEPVSALARAQESLDAALSVLRAPPDELRGFLAGAMATVCELRTTLRDPARDLELLRDKLTGLKVCADRLGGKARDLGLTRVADACVALATRAAAFRDSESVSGDAMLSLALLVDRIAGGIGDIWRLEEQRHAPRAGATTGTSGGGTTGKPAAKPMEWARASERRWAGFLRRRGENAGTLIKLRMEGAELVQLSLRRHVDQVLQHLLRNAVEHGIETPEQRVAAGKPPAGQVGVKFEDHGEAGLAMTVRDDGRGFRFHPDDAQAHGRGVSFVRHVVAQLGGHLQVATKRGHYTEFNIQLPKADSGPAEGNAKAVSLDNA